MKQRNQYGTAKTSRGFSTLELLLVMVVSLVIAALAIPGFNQARRALRISGDGRELNGAINQAKLQAAADFTRTRVYADTAATNLAHPFNWFRIELWNKTLNGGNGCWETVGDQVLPGTPPVHRCTVSGPGPLPGNSPYTPLSQNIAFGFAGIAAPPLNTQTVIAQAGPCEAILGGGGTIGNSACIVFNSRGIPIVTPGTNTGTGAGVGVPNGNQAFYINDLTAVGNGATVNTQVYGVTVGTTGVSQVWARNVQGGGNWYMK